jgi:hypothetical protein
VSSVGRGARTAGRVAGLVLLAAVGTVTGVAGSFLHDVSVEVLGVDLPLGLAAALVAAFAAYVLAGWVLRNRLAVLAPGVGWLVPVLALSLPRPEGDLVVAANLPGYVFLLGGSAMIGLGIALPYGSGASGARVEPVRPVP